MAKILIGDDSLDLLEFLSHLLNLRNYEVETAKS